MKSSRNDSMKIQGDQEIEAKEESESYNQDQPQGSIHKNSAPESPCSEECKGKTDSNYKKSYIKLSKDNILELKQFYAKNPYPNRQELGLFAKKFNFSFLKVENWFKHKRRTQIKKGLLENPKKKIFSKKELLILKKNLISCKRPSPEKYEELAQQLNCSLKNVKNWYYKRKRYLKMDAARQANELAKGKEKLQKMKKRDEKTSTVEQIEEEKENEQLKQTEEIEKISESSTKETNTSPRISMGHNEHFQSNQSPKDPRALAPSVLIPSPLKLYSKQQIKEEYNPAEYLRSQTAAEDEGKFFGIPLGNLSQMSPYEREAKFIEIIQNCYRKYEEQEATIQHYRFVLGNLMSYMEEKERNKTNYMPGSYYNFSNGSAGFGSKLFPPEYSMMNLFPMNQQKSRVFGPPNLNFPTVFGNSSNI